MRPHLLPAAALSLLALCLLAIPPDRLSALRLRARSLFVAAGQPDVPSTEPAGASSAAAEADRATLEERLLQQTAEIIRLRTRLRNLTDLRNRYPAIQFHTATVVLYEIGSERLTIDRGSADGLRTGSGVLQGLGLAGTVAHLAPEAAEIRLLSHAKSFIPGRVAETGEICTVEGRGRGRVRVVFYGAGTRARRGQHVLTSGLLGILPPDLVIGTLGEDPAEGEAANTQRAELRTRLRPSSLHDVVVVQPLSPQAGAPDATE